jgi:acetyl esterase/lipase
MRNNAVTRFHPWAGLIHPVAVGLAMAVLALAAGCSRPPVEQGIADPASSTRAPDSTTEYLPGLEADVYLPGPGTDGAAVVLLVPGGGWQTADRTGLAPLAASLADAGFVAVSATYRAGEDGVAFPVPVQDVMCASAFAAEAARSGGVDPGPVVVLGHSAGGHLASLAALEGAGLAGPCPYPAPRIDGLIGVAGVYDVREFEFALVDFFGGSPQEQPEAWRRGDPIGLVDSGSVPEGLQVLLLHGDSDADVPVEQSEAFEASLSRADVPVRLEVVPRATHQTIYSADVAGPPAIAWINELFAGRSTG